MKCIQCGTDNNLKDRTANQGYCKNCRHPFVFEPITMGKLKITDPMFVRVITDLSLNNTLFFTSKQLFYLLDRRLRRKSFNLATSSFNYIFYSAWTVVVIGSSFSSSIGNISYVIAFIANNLIWIFYLFNQSKSHKNNAQDRKNIARMLIFLGLIIIILGIYTKVSVLNSFIFLVITIAVGLLSTYLGIRQINQTSNSQEFLFDRTQFQQWLDRWQSINGSIEKLLPAPQEQTTPATVNPDITAYSFDRLIVCDSANIAQVLIANNFHFENNCAILSVTGYPQTIFSTIMQMLRRNPDLQVYAVHDCSPRGLSLVNRLRNSSQWFADTDISITDIGLTPRQIMQSSRGLFIQNKPDSAQAAQELSAEIHQSLSSQEIQWLESGNFVELESFTPKRLIQVLNRCIARASNFSDEDNNFVITDDTSDDIYLVQSFG